MRDRWTDSPVQGNFSTINCDFSINVIYHSWFLRARPRPFSPLYSALWSHLAARRVRAADNAILIDNNGGKGFLHAVFNFPRNLPFHFSAEKVKNCRPRFKVATLSNNRSVFFTRLIKIHLSEKVISSAVDITVVLSYIIVVFIYIIIVFMYVYYSSIYIYIL